MTHRAVTTTGAPAAVGPYSQGIVADGSALHGRPGVARPGDRARSWRAASGRRPSGSLANLTAILDAAGATWADVVKTTIFLVDIADFAAVNAIYARFLADPPPARSTVGVAALPEGRPRRDRGDRTPAALTSARLTLRTGRPYHAATLPMTSDPHAPGPHGVESDRRRPTRAPRRHSS